MGEDRLTDASTMHPHNGSMLGIMAAARLGMAALADVDGLSAAKDPADTIQGALDRWRDDFNARPATVITVTDSR